ncbi:class I SAM-dependent methyltransferase [Nodularia sphaerocarpa]|uniref:class I SAM-dependent methyltransferase n=1 Tax=Nodularia sphaerocarpa TaxID=137816 RepID=UPI001EFBA333|nr:methyltransferase domain-containing protein [Nodularia sphaerocarpa]MDB9372408.1 methyltransferase domain-containing protein [Nodularia sphaerocarpa CS-585]MDB9378247.1 methyltransferase domain-containing protein [Nodularia sphaerocarpa CS-585A2]ULP71026.1 putative methyltransferase YcgJ [Nodularia sphaerocarpa UHCC 0038]
MKLITILLLLLNFLFTPITTANAISLSDNIYEQRANPSSDGIGKSYMGREIAKVMGHTGAGWLERPRREVEEQPSKIVSALNLQPHDIVADIGAGTGYLSFRIAPLLTEGKVFAVDIQPEMLEIVEFFKQEKHISNVEPILATLTNPNLRSASVDLALMVDAYHELEYPQEVMTAIVKALKPGGKVVLVEYRGENPLIMIKRLHKMTQKQVQKEMQAVGLVWRETKNLLPQQHLMIFEKQV